MGVEGLAAVIVTIHEPALKIATSLGVAVGLITVLVLSRVRSPHRYGISFVVGGVVLALVYLLATKSAGVRFWDVEVVRIREASSTESSAE